MDGVPSAIVTHHAAFAEAARVIVSNQFVRAASASDAVAGVHPQTIVVYAQDGRYLNAAWGAPARVYSPVKLGYKNTKYLTKIVFLPNRNGGYWSDRGYEWYAGV